MRDENDIDNDLQGHVICYIGAHSRLVFNACDIHKKTRITEKIDVQIQGPFRLKSTVLKIYQMSRTAVATVTNSRKKCIAID